MIIMPQKNAIWVGLLLGLLVPFVAYALLLTIFEQLEMTGIVSRDGLSPQFRERTLSVVAIGLNVFVFNYYARRRFFVNTMRGMVIATVICVGVWAAIFWKNLF
jgi:hypothetical protein